MDRFEKITDTGFNMISRLISFVPSSGRRKARKQLLDLRMDSSDRVRLNLSH
jgi:hypothetical protein